MNSPIPHELRIGHAERDAATTELAEHYAVGRIDYEEHARRLDQIWAARTGTELRAAFVDLPGAYYQPPPMGPVAPMGSVGRPAGWSPSGDVRSVSWVTQRVPPAAAQRGRVGPCITRMPTAIQVALVVLLVAMIAANLPIVVVVGALWLLLRRGSRG